MERGTEVFRIMQGTPGNVKVHFCSTKEIADEVSVDLSNRFVGSFHVDKMQESSCVWDPGGMKILDQEEFSFILKNCVILCDAQHFGFFSEHIQRYTARGVGTEYVKIHGHWACICITVEEFEDLKLQVNNPDFIKKAEEVAEARENRLNNLAKEGYIARHDEDGNMYEYKFVDKKSLN